MSTSESQGVGGASGSIFPSVCVLFDATRLRIVVAAARDAKMMTRASHNTQPPRLADPNVDKRHATCPFCEVFFSRWFLFLCFQFLGTFDLPIMAMATARVAAAEEEVRVAAARVATGACS